MEAELIEPYLYPLQGPEFGEMLAEAVLALGAQSGKLRTMTEPADLTAFRAEVRAFLAESLTPELARAGRRATSVFSEPAAFDCRGRRSSPPKAGGRSIGRWNMAGPAGRRCRSTFSPPNARAPGTPSLLPQGLKMVAPVMMHYGSDEQKAFFLPRILSGEHYWCQGFSEPGSGSDLASLKLKAERDGDDYVLNGSKIWTTHAHHANWMFALVRTSSEGKPQAGISFVLIDMATPGSDGRSDHFAGRASTSSIRCSSTMSVCRWRTGWARKTTAGRSPNTC